VIGFFGYLSLVNQIVFIASLYLGFLVVRNRLPGGILYLAGLFINIPSFVISVNGSIGDIQGLKFGDAGGMHDAIVSVEYYLGPVFSILSVTGAVLSVLGLVKIFRYAISMKNQRSDASNRV